MERMGDGVVGKSILSTDGPQSGFEGLDGNGLQVALAPGDGTQIEAEKPKRKGLAVFKA